MQSMNQREISIIYWYQANPDDKQMKKFGTQSVITYQNISLILSEENISLKNDFRVTQYDSADMKNVLRIIDE